MIFKKSVKFIELRELIIFFMKVVLVDQLHLQRFIDRLLVFGEPTTHLILSDLGDTT
jgi:hypothetical protein